MKDKELNYETLYDAVEHALANFLCTEDLDQNVIELVANRIAEHWDERYSASFDNILESTSTYVMTDLDECELVDYVGELDTQLGDYELY